MNRASENIAVEDYKNNVVTYLYENAEKFPEREAFRWIVDADVEKHLNGLWEAEYKSINYRDFFIKILKTADGLKKSGFERGDRVIIFLPISVDLYVSLAAVMMIGARAVFLDSWSRRGELGYCASLVEPKGIISFKKAMDYLVGISEIQKIPQKIISITDMEKLSDNDELNNKSVLNKIQKVFFDETALITFTTGSSGTPKGADRTHGFLSSQHNALKRTIPYEADDLDLPVFPVFSLNNLASAVSMVIPAIDAGKPGERDAEIIAGQIISQNVTTATLSPSMVVRLGEYCINGGIKLLSLRRIITGGAPVGESTVRKIKEVIPNGDIEILYGSTEVEPITHISSDAYLKFIDRGKGVVVGKIDVELDYKIIDIIKKPLKINETAWESIEKKRGDVGELVVTGPHVCKSYYKNPEADEKTKILDLSGKIWHRTGDLAWIDEDENLWLVGRVHNVINRKGVLLYPVEIEETLKKHRAVKNAAYTGIPDKNLNEKASVIIELKEEFKNNRTSIIEEINMLLENKNYVYDEILTVDFIPMDPRHNSKVDYVSLIRAVTAKKV